MTTPTLDEIVTRLERLENDFRSLRRSPIIEGTGDWRSAVGQFDNDPSFAEIQNETKAIRDLQRAEINRNDAA